MATVGSEVVGHRYPLTAAEDAAFANRQPGEILAAALRDLVLAGIWKIKVLEKKGWLLTTITRIAVPSEKATLTNPLLETIHKFLLDQVTDWNGVRGANVDRIVGGEVSGGWSLEDLYNGAAMRLSDLDLADLSRSIGGIGITQRANRRPLGKALSEPRDFWVIWTQLQALNKLENEEAVEVILGASSLAVGNRYARKRILELCSPELASKQPPREPLRSTNGVELGDLGNGIDLESLLSTQVGRERLQMLETLDGLAESGD